MTWVPGGLAVDIGAYMGVYSIAAVMAGAANVTAVEPNPHVLRKLKANLKLNGAKSVEILEVALSDGVGTAELIAPRPRWSRRPRNQSSGVQLQDASNGREIRRWRPIARVPVVTLDSLLPIERHSEVSAIKMDVEGYEVTVLRGAASILQKSRPELLIESWTWRKQGEGPALLHDFGYALVEELDGINQHWSPRS